MGLDFGKPSMGNPAQAGNGLQEKNEIEVVEKYDIVADRQQMNAELVNSKEVDDIVSTIEVYNMDTIVSFGAKAAEEISNQGEYAFQNCFLCIFRCGFQDNSGYERSREASWKR